jgi:hypothetical protein
LLRNRFGGNHAILRGKMAAASFYAGNCEAIPVLGSELSLLAFV